MSEIKLIVCEVCGKEWPDHLYYDCPFCFEKEDDRIFEQRVLRRIEVINLSPSLEKVYHYLLDHYSDNVWYVDKQNSIISIGVKSLHTFSESDISIGVNKIPYTFSKMVFITKIKGKLALVDEAGLAINSLEDLNTAYKNLMNKYFKKGKDNE